MSSTIPTHLKFKPPNFLKPPVHNHTPVAVFSVKKFTKNPRAQHYCLRLELRNPMLCCCKFSVLTRACSDGGQGEIFAAKKQPSASVSTLLIKINLDFSTCMYLIVCVYLDNIQYMHISRLFWLCNVMWRSISCLDLNFGVLRSERFFFFRFLKLLCHEQWMIFAYHIRDLVIEGLNFSSVMNFFCGLSKCLFAASFFLTVVFKFSAFRDMVSGSSNKQGPLFDHSSILSTALTVSNVSDFKCLIMYSCVGAMILICLAWLSFS